jgi:hypothetical protein
MMTVKHDTFSGILRRTLGALLLFIVMAAPAALAQVGGAAVVFLQIEPDSRAAGMGNAGVALADNASAVFWNPAGLATQRGAEISFTHANWLPALVSDLFYEYLVGKYHVEGLGTFGGHVTFLNLGEQEYRDGQNVLLGTFRSYELAVGGAFARNVTENFALGLGARFIYSNLSGGVTLGDETQTKAGTSVGFDIGGLYSFNEIETGGVSLTPRLGFNLANMGPKIGYTVGDTGRNDPIPTNLRFGGALETRFDEFNRLNFAIDLNKTLVDFDSTGSKPFYEAIVSSWKSIDVCRSAPVAGECQDVETVGILRQITLGTGLEYWYNDLFALRSGFFYEDPYNGNRKFLTFGAGIRYNLVGVDFSYIYPLEEDSPLANTIRFSLMLNIQR